MRLSDGSHLTYCTNVHPGEDWRGTLAQLNRFLPAVKSLASPHAPMGVGLRLSAQAARELENPRTLRSFRGFLDEHGLYVFTLNGFPYGRFHGGPVKEAVYRPDWRSPLRLDYTLRLARLLAALLPEGMTGSISTVPLGFRADREDTRMAEHLAAAAEGLAALEARTGRTILLGLEPEPACLLETAAEAVDWIRSRLWQRPEGAAVRRHLGLCLDACHGAVMGEDPAEAVALARAAGVPVVKLQLSSALAADGAQAPGLARFDDGIYLHQVVRGGNGRARSFPDLPQALAEPDPDCQWRVHLHVPVWAEQLGAFGTTRPILEALLALQSDQPIAPHLEVETYTWTVLPPELQPASLAEAIARELAWVRGRLA